MEQGHNAGTQPGAPNNPSDSASLVSQVVANQAAAEPVHETMLLEQQRVEMQKRMHRISVLLEIVRGWAHREQERLQIKQ